MEPLFPSVDPVSGPGVFRPGMERGPAAPGAECRTADLLSLVRRRRTAARLEAGRPFFRCSAPRGRHRPPRSPGPPAGGGGGAGGRGARRAAPPPPSPWPTPREGPGGWKPRGRFSDVPPHGNGTVRPVPRVIRSGRLSPPGSLPVFSCGSCRCSTWAHIPPWPDCPTWPSPPGLRGQTAQETAPESSARSGG